MKYIKKFENEHNFKVGDYIKCISKEYFMNLITINSVYKIEGIKTDIDKVLNNFNQFHIKSYKLI